MKAIKIIIAAALMLLAMSACKQQLCPGYGNLHTEVLELQQNA
jgi:hypothetical protein